MTQTVDHHGLLGRIAVHHRLISPAQLVAATQEQARLGPESKLGEVLVKMGFINAQQLQQLLYVQQQVMARQQQVQQQQRLTGTMPNPMLQQQQQGGATSQADTTQPHAVASQTQPSQPPTPSSSQTSQPPQPPVGATQQIPAMSVQASATGDPDATSQYKVPSGSGPAVQAPPKKKKAAPPPDDDDEEEVPLLKDMGGQQSSTVPERLNAILLEAMRGGASDVHFHVGVPIRGRVLGKLFDMRREVLSADDTKSILLEALTESQQETLKKTGQLDFAHTIEGVGRFRANCYRQRTGIDGVFRIVPLSAPSLQQLGLPNELARLTTYHQGMVLFTGPAGCGKSTTMSALLNLINEEREDHILTVEDPIECIHHSKRCVVNQRQVNRHTESFSRALKAALREDPDIIVIGELRDLETISLAMTAAETGHLVLGTLHTNSAIRTLNRLIGAFPPNQQAQVRTMLSESLRAILSQRLVPTTSGKNRVPALELLYVTRAVGNTIRENRTYQLRSTLLTGKSQGMLLMDNSLNDLVSQGIIDKQVALSIAEDKKLIRG